VLFFTSIFVIIIIDNSQFNFFNTHNINSFHHIFIFSYHTFALIFLFFSQPLYSKNVTLFLVLILSANSFNLIFSQSFILITSLVQTALIINFIFLFNNSFIIHLNLSYHLSNTHIHIVHIILSTSSNVFMLSLFSDINSSDFVEYNLKFNGIFIGFQFLSILVATTLFKQYQGTNFPVLPS
jgi:hypothetical protein